MHLTLVMCDRVKKEKTLLHSTTMPPKSATEKLAEAKVRHDAMQCKLKEAQCEADWEEADWACEERKKKEHEEHEKCDAKKHEEATKML